jgi:hypothetical protein
MAIYVTPSYCVNAHVFCKLALQKLLNMKKMLLAFIFLTGLGAYSHAQTTPAKTKKPATTTAATTKTTAATTKTTATAGPTKKDGSADMRYKANKDAAKTTTATTHTKKDGTPDKRYKENKK